MEIIKAKKVNMTQIWNGDKVVPVTICKSEKADKLKDGDVVTVSGISKGKGFQGVVKRHGFHGGPQTHGQKNRLRAPGSIGSTAPQRVIKGRRMAGHMGNERVTVRGLEVAQVKVADKLILIKGAVPGARGGMLEIRK